MTYGIAFFTRITEILWGINIGIIAYGLACLFMMIVYIKGKSCFKRYRELLRNVHDGRTTMAISTALIYILLIFTAAYPQPLIERIEYIPVYFLLSITILSFYVVFIMSLVQKRKLSDLNEQLINEQKWHKIAYEDAVTGLKNRMAYVEKILVRDISTELLKQKIDHLSDSSLKETGCTISIGYSIVDFSQINALSAAFNQADQKMYAFRYHSHRRRPLWMQLLHSLRKP